MHSENCGDLWEEAAGQAQDAEQRRWGALAGVSSRAGVHPDLGVSGSSMKLAWGTCWQGPSWQAGHPGSVDSGLD